MAFLALMSGRGEGRKRQSTALPARSDTRMQARGWPAKPPNLLDP
jgi:hypothetical protein